MKKIILSLLLCFAAVNAYAMTAREVYEKSLKSDFLQFLSQEKSYIIEYDLKTNSTIKSVQENTTNMKFSYRHVSDGAKQRYDITYYPEKDPGNVLRYSVIITEETSYVSLTSKGSENGSVFINYKVLTSTNNLQNMQSVGESAKSDNSDFKNEKGSHEDFFKDLEKYSEYVFDTAAPKSSKDYIIKYSVKDKKKVIKNAYDKKEKNEELSSQEAWLLLSSFFDMKYGISKDKYLMTGYDFVVDEEAAKYAHELQKEKNKTEEDYSAKEEKFSFKGTFSDYRHVEGSKYMFPFFINIENALGDYFFTYEFKTKFFKIANSEDLAAEFVPTNIKKGKGRLPGVLIINSVSMNDMLVEMRDEMIKNLKESIKEQVKEQSKEMLKKSLKDTFKGFSGF